MPLRMRWCVLCAHSWIAGLATQQSVTILSGISAGDRLASDNLDKLHDGDKVKVGE